VTVVSAAMVPLLVEQASGGRVPAERRQAVRIAGSRLRLGAIALGAALLDACATTVQLRPQGAGWTVRGGEATWRSGDVEVVAGLATSSRSFPSAAVLRNYGPAPVTVSFVPTSVRPETALGEIRSAAGDGSAATRIVAGTLYEVPPLQDLAPGRLEFALRPDDPWYGAPPVGSAITHSLQVRTPSGEVRCPYEFRVESSTTELTTVGKVVIAILILAALAAAFAHSSSEMSHDLENYPMGN
jgi:hypothetical protein